MARARKDLDPNVLYYGMGECARAMGVDIKTARARLRKARALQQFGRGKSKRFYTTRSLIEQHLARSSSELLARLERARPRSGEK